jgi:hypothetical protein
MSKMVPAAIGVARRGRGGEGRAFMLDLGSGLSMASTLRRAMVESLLGEEMGEETTLVREDVDEIPLSCDEKLRIEDEEATG